MNYELLLGDCIETMRGLPSGIVQTCITSPPYYGLRDYGTASWEGGDAECDHKLVSDNTKQAITSTLGGSKRNVGNALSGYGAICGKCGARRVDNQIGLEPDPESYVAKLVEVFREVRRLLRDDGTLWLNLASSYNGSGGAGGDYGEGGLKEGQPKYPGRSLSNFKPKDMIPIPWMVAMALQQDGWWLRQDIIWHKVAPMPESVTDRCTKAHEYVFLLSKSAHYYYDQEAIREPHTTQNLQYEMHKASKRKGISAKPHTECSVDRDWEPGDGTNGLYHPNGRNKRSVWTLGPESYSGAHFATMPTKLVEPCILAGTSARGCCAKCGAPWARVTEKDGEYQAHWSPGKQALVREGIHGGTGVLGTGMVNIYKTVGWEPTCACQADVVPCTVLDPFSGSGTVGAVALKHGRKYIGLELNESYIELAHRRIQQSQPMLLLEGV